MSQNSKAQNYYQKMVDLMKNKKALKTIQPMLDYKPYEENPFEQYKLIEALIDGINWTSLFNKQQIKESREYVKVSYFGKKIKLLSQQENFIDYFALTVLRCSSLEILKSNLQKIISILKLDINYEIILVTSLAFQNKDLDLQVKSFQALLNYLEKYEKIGKPLDFPQNFILFFVKFYKLNKQNFEKYHQQIQYFFQSSQENIKDSKLKSLLTLNEPQYFDKEANYMDNFSNEYMNCLHQQISLTQIIKEMGSQISYDEEKITQILSGYQTIEIKEIFHATLMMLQENYQLQKNQEQEAQNDQTIAWVTFAFLNSNKFSIDGAFKQAKNSQENKNWNIKLFLKTAKKFYGKKINWNDYFRVLINTNENLFENFPEKNFFLEFFQLLEDVKECTGIQIPQDLLYIRWKKIQNQNAFLFHLLNDNTETNFDLINTLDKERNLQKQNFPQQISQKIEELPLLLQNKTLLKILIELSNKNEFYNQTKEMMERYIKQNFEGMFVLLVSLEISTGNNLLNDILEKMVISILNSSTTLADLIECFFKINQKYMSFIFYQICKQDNNFLYLSKILDYSQTIKDFFLPLTQTDYHYFSISLSLLAVKREFLRLENWVEGRLLQGDLQWVEEFMEYIQNKILKPLQSYTTPSKALIDEVLEKSQITVNGLAIVFENFFLNSRFTNHISKRIKENIKEFYDKIQIYIPELSQVCTNDTEKQANRLLEELYFGQAKIDEFIQGVLKLKQSSNNRDQEILSCIIINIIDEFRFYQNFPEKELLITGDIFGQFISQKIIDGKILIVFLKALSDSLQKEGKMYQFGIRALNHFIMDVSLDINLDFYRLLFANAKLRNKEFKLLQQLHEKLQEKYQDLQIPNEHVEQIKQKIQQHESTLEKKKTLKQRSEKKTLKQRLNVASFKYKEKTLLEYLKQTFQQLDKNIQLEKKIKEKIIFWLNSVEDKKTDVKDFLCIVDNNAKIQWFSIYLVFDRIPFEHQNQITYKKLILKSNIKELYYQIQKRTLQMMNGLMDFLISKEELQTTESNIARYCGKWACQITLMCNRPIPLKDFDIKEKILRALMEHKIQNIMPTVCYFLQQLDKKSFFNIKVPYINSLLDILKEIFILDWIPNNIKVQIDILFNRLEIKQKDIYPFNYIKKKTSQKKQQIPKRKKLFQNKISLREVVKLDPDSLYEEIQQKFQFDLKQIIAVAINNSIEDIIVPVLNRSVSNTLETTRELIIKDFVAEPDERKIMNAAEAMITNLTWYIALVTCKEPLRVQITQHLTNCISRQGQQQLNEHVIKKMAENLSNLNLNLACDIVKNIVVENALNDIQKDKLLQKEIAYRIYQRENHSEFTSENLVWLENSLPEELSPKNNNKNLKKIEIYNKVKNLQQNMDDDYQYHFMQISQMPSKQKNNFEDEKINSLLTQIENIIQSPNNQEKMKTLHNIYAQINKILQGAKNVENHIFPYAENVLKKLFFIATNHLTMDVLRYYSDLLIIYSNVSPKLPKMITQWIFQHQNQIFRHHLLSVFLRRNLMHLRDFDQGYAQILKQNNIEALNCIVQILKGLVIEDKIFSIHSFPSILDQLTRIGKTSLIEQLNLEISIFIKSLIDYVENTSKINSLMFRLTNLEPEYKKLFQDVIEYFKNTNSDIYHLVRKSLKSWMKAENEKEQLKVISKFLSCFNKDNEKSVIIFFCYMFEISVNQSIQNLDSKLQKFEKLEYKYIDNLTKLIAMLVKNSEDGTYYFEKILTSLIIVLTKKHFYEQNQFNQKSFFKILINIMYDLNNDKFGHSQNIDKFSVALVQTLHILQPIKYPAFSFAWLQLISCKFLVQTLLKKDNHEIWNHYTILIVDLMIFYKNIFCVNFLSNEEMKKFYKGTLRILLILIHDFPDFLSEQSFVILEEIPVIFKQFRNIILSAFPKNLKMPNPFQTDNQIMNSTPEFQSLPILSQKIEVRINCHNLHSILINFIKKTDHAESQTENLNFILEKFYIYGYKNQLQLNIPLLESFVVYVPQFLYQNIYNSQNLQNFENFQKQSYALFIRILSKEDYDLREAMINAMLNNLRYPNFITFYFIKLIIIIYEQLDDHILFEQILSNLLSRLTIEKPHPWGILSLTYKLMYESNFINKDYYKQNEKYISEMVKVAFKYGKIDKAMNN